MLLNYTASADVGLALIQNTCLSYNFCMPNKLFEYAMAALPVIVSNVKEMSAFVKKNQMGTILMSNTVEAINQEIDNFLSMDLNSLKKNVKKVALKYSWQQQEKKMKKIYQNLHKRM
jgi:glycosyltransferase involved in cell wall biosynthesis